MPPSAYSHVGRVAAYMTVGSNPGSGHRVIPPLSGHQHKHSGLIAKGGISPPSGMLYSGLPNETPSLALPCAAMPTKYAFSIATDLTLVPAEKLTTLALDNALDLVWQSTHHTQNNFYLSTYKARVLGALAFYSISCTAGLQSIACVST